jgi:plasmid stabilization system protein ParE
MSVSIHFTRTAQMDLAEISAYLQLTFGEETAQKGVVSILEKIRLLGDFPSLGTPLPNSFALKADYRLLNIQGNVVFYLVSKDGVEVLSIVSSKERFRSLFSHS